jgi:hypothetical protein
MTTYIEELADKIKASVPSDVLPEGDIRALFLIYATLALAKGSDVTHRDVHNAWAAWMAATTPSHESIRPFEELPESTRREDDPFVTAIRSVAQAADASADSDGVHAGD